MHIACYLWKTEGHIKCFSICSGGLSATSSMCIITSLPLLGIDNITVKLCCHVSVQGMLTFPWCYGTLPRRECMGHFISFLPQPAAIRMGLRADKGANLSHGINFAGEWHHGSRRYKFLLLSLIYRGSKHEAAWKKTKNAAHLSWKYFITYLASVFFRRLAAYWPVSQTPAAIPYSPLPSLPNYLCRFLMTTT